jgi:hypothetical protein
VRIINVGLDFESKHKTISGSVEYYRKKGKEIMGQAPVDPTLGLTNTTAQSFYYGNVASMTGHGVDLELNTRNIDRKFKWYSAFLFSYAISKVSEYLMPVSASGLPYLVISSGSASTINPVVNKPVFSVYSFPWRGLDPATGDPMGYYNGTDSKDWTSIYNQSPLDSLVYNGPAQPTIFGAIRNTLYFGNFEFSFNISYKAGYYLRRSSIHYSDLFNTWNGHNDYAKRWQKPGDELTTNVPSIVYPANSTRDAFYQYSEILVEKANHVRLEDITLSYQLDKTQWKKLPFTGIRLYLYANNFGVLWTANKLNIDPYYNNIPKEGKSIAIGMNINF